MRLSVKALTIALAVLWGGCVLLAALCNLIWTGYAGAFLDVVSSIYPGYHAGGFGSVIVVTLYALVDGAIAGAVIAWLYNAALGPGTTSA